MYTHEKIFISKGKPLNETGKALVMIHGRGGYAQNMLGLQQELPLQDFTLFAPQATNHSWYPYSFMVPAKQNQPALDSALQLIDMVVQEILQEGAKNKDIYFLGFSQGACLSLEYLARNAQRYGGIIALTGGLIGEKPDTSKYQGDFDNTPLLLTTGDPDPHIPLSRVHETLEIMEELGADVTLKVYKGRPHSIMDQELELAARIFEKGRL